MNIPNKIIIGSLTYEVKDMSKMETESYHGRCSTINQIITINKEKGRDRQELTLMHEIIHIILDEAGYTDLSGDEKIVNLLANRLVEVLKNNKLF